MERHILVEEFFVLDNYETYYFPKSKHDTIAFTSFCATVRTFNQGGWKERKDCFPYQSQLADTDMADNATESSWLASLV